MKDKTFDETEFRCPNCQRVFPGKHINNWYEGTGICDWCAVGIMLRDQGIEIPRMEITTGILGEPESFKTEIIEGGPYPPKPSEVN